MYIFLLTLKTPSSVFSLAILLYSVVLAIICPRLKKGGKKLITVVLCLLPLIVALIHLAIYGLQAFWIFFYLYIEALIPLINLLPGRKKLPVAIKSVLSSILALVVCVLFLFDLLGSPIVHNYTRMSYTQSFKKMLATMEKEYCLSSWKKIDYDGLLKEYLPRVEEAEKNNDESAYAAVVTEVTYRFYDYHVYTALGYDIDEDVMNRLTGNDYGLSMIKLDDGTVIAIFVEDGNGMLYDEPHDITKLGIHNMANLIIIGTPDEIAKNSEGFDITGATIVDPFNDPNKQKYIDKFVELRGVDTMVAAAKKKAEKKGLSEEETNALIADAQKKGITPEKAEEKMNSDYMYYACLMCKCGDADGAVSGACHSTGNTILPALQLLKTKPGISSVSGFFLMDVPNCDLAERSSLIYAVSSREDEADAVIKASLI